MMNDGHNYDLRFLSMNNFDNVKTYQEMLQNDQYMQTKQIPMMEDPGVIFELIETGAMYGYKRATGQGSSPILILNVRKALDLGFLQPDITSAVIFMMTYTTYAGFVPGEIEQWVLFIDGTGVSIFEIPL